MAVRLLCLRNPSGIFLNCQTRRLWLAAIGEYARESDFIRRVVQNLKNVYEGKGSRKPVDAANRELVQFHLIGIRADLFHRLSFPKPWQRLTETDRKVGTNFIAKIPVPKQYPPFQSSNFHSIAAELYGQARKIHDEKTTMWQRLSELSTGVTGLKEAIKLREQLASQEEHLPMVIVRGIGGVDSFIGQVNWQDFTDKQIVTAFKMWVADNRPKPVAADTKLLVGRRIGKGYKLNDWRVMLSRLSIMRLLHYAKLDEMREKFPVAWKRYGKCIALEGDGRDYFGVDWSRERKNANRDFHRLFQFLPKNELPLSWKTKGGHR